MSSGLKQDISIGGNLRALRRNAGMTQSEAAAKLQLMGIPITPDILAKMEQGKYSIRISVLVALKDIYHVQNFDVFFSGLSVPSNASK